MNKIFVNLLSFATVMSTTTPTFSVTFFLYDKWQFIIFVQVFDILKIQLKFVVLIFRYESIFRLIFTTVLLSLNEWSNNESLRNFCLITISIVFNSVWERRNSTFNWTFQFDVNFVGETTKRSWLQK